MKKGKVFVVAGPSGVGKSTLINRALEQVDGVYFSVSATTRPRRPGEVEGRDYFFKSDDEFDDLTERDAFLEWEEVYGRRYGTLKSEVEKAVRSGRDILLELDVKGARNVRSKIGDALLIFIKPPALEDLKSRLGKRNLDTEEEMKSRTDVAPREMEAGEKDFDVVIVNDDADRAAGELADVLRGEKGFAWKKNRR